MWKPGPWEKGCRGVGSQELVGGGLTSARRTAPNGQAGTQDRHPRHRLASMAGKSPRSNWTSAWGLQAVRAWQVVHVWQTCRSIRRMGRIVPRWCSILSYRHRAHNIARTICGCCFAAHTSRAMAASTSLTPVSLDVIVCPANRRCVHASGPGWRSLYGKPCSSFHRADPPGFHRPAGGHGSRAAPGPCERRSRLGRANRPGCHPGERATVPPGIDADLPGHRHARSSMSTIPPAGPPWP